jgi:hypothetical protein
MRRDHTVSHPATEQRSDRGIEEEPGRPGAPREERGRREEEWGGEGSEEWGEEEWEREGRGRERGGTRGRVR